DSDMFTLGYSFRPWQKSNSVASGPAILDYLRATAQHFGIDRHIRFGHRVRSASWFTEEARWTVETEVGAERRPIRYTCNFLFLWSGSNDEERGPAPTSAGGGISRGGLLHPNPGPRALASRGRRVVVIGGGAPAVTLVPAMAESAAHVTMLQRSPSYILSIAA